MALSEEGEERVFRLGPVVLAAVLLGVPRALDARAFGAQRSVYVELASWPSELQDFAAELERAIEETAYSLAARPSEATVVVEVVNVARTSGSDGGMEAVAFAVREGQRARPLVLHYAPGQRADAARLLLERLPGAHA
jgi:hypothetical protein